MSVSSCLRRSAVHPRFSGHNFPWRTIPVSRRARISSSSAAGPSTSAQDFRYSEADESRSDDSRSGNGESSSRLSSTWSKVFESAATTAASLAMLGLAGYGYHKYYKHLVLQKMRNAFAPGDPMLDLADHGRGFSGSRDVASSTVRVSADADADHWMRQSEQAIIDNIVDGTIKGNYHLIIGEKGTGKSSMLLDAMTKIRGEGVSMLEAHANLEIFRIRLGRALDYEFHEDYIGSLFSIKGPREGNTALLDIERAFNKLEKVALERRAALGKPLVLIINSTHLLRDDDDGNSNSDNGNDGCGGRDLLELIQQRAEQWSASNLVTVVLNSDDYWVYERLKRHATRMQVLQVLDLPKDQAISALKQYRRRYYDQEPSVSLLDQVYDRVGGRLTFLARVAAGPDMLATCAEICETEKTWFLNNCWILGEEMDDDVMDQQKFAAAGMVLAKALVDQAQQKQHCSLVKSETTAADRPSPSYSGGSIVPQLPLHQARQVMTRADFMKAYDHINIFSIDAKAMVRADSVPMQNAFLEICNQPGFEEHLQATLDRISAIESLGRTRELVAKDLVQGQRYKIDGSSPKGTYTVKLEQMP